MKGVASSPGTRLERLRSVEQIHRDMSRAISRFQADWESSQKTNSDRLKAVTDVTVAIFGMAIDLGLSEFGRDRANDLVVELGELDSGRRSKLLVRREGVSNKPAPIDQSQQGLAQACVTLLRNAGLGADEARREVASYFAAAGFKRFGISKLRAINTALTGPGCEKHEAYGSFHIVIDTIREKAKFRIINGKPHADDVRSAIKRAIAKVKRSDNRIRD